MSGALLIGKPWATASGASLGRLFWAPLRDNVGVLDAAPDANCGFRVGYRLGRRLLDGAVGDALYVAPDGHGLGSRVWGLGLDADVGRSFAHHRGRLF